MSNKKVISTLTHLINTGISAITYYDISTNPKHKKLKKAVAYWEGDVLCFRYKDKVHRLMVIAEANNEETS